MRTTDASLVIVCVTFLGTCMLTMYQTVLPPIYNTINMDTSSSSSDSSLDVSITIREELLKKINVEVANITGHINRDKNMNYLIKLLRDLNHNHLLSSKNVTEDILHMKNSTWKPPPKYWSKSKEKLYIDMHDTVLKTEELVLPFNLSKETREDDIASLKSVMEQFNQQNDRPKEPKKVKLNMFGLKANTTWQKFHNHMNNFELFSAGSLLVDQILIDLNEMEIVDGSQKSGETQIKMKFTLKDGGKAIFKPNRFSRSQGTLANHFYYNDYERPNAEIAAFHLDRLLKFHKTPPVIGRVVNITRDIYRFADDDFARTFFVSPANNLCFHGDCIQFCDTPHAVCGDPVMLEGSMAAMIQVITKFGKGYMESEKLDRKTMLHPWRRSYSNNRQVEWELNPDYCDVVMEKFEFLAKGRTLLDLMDMAVFDFLMGNEDRHHYELITNFGKDTYPFYYDHGRGWGKPHIDDLSAAAPLYHCCVIRRSTLETLINFNDGPLTLGQALKISLSRDPVTPVLLEDQFEAVDRRVKIILQIMYKCLDYVESPRDMIKDLYMD